MEHEPGKLWTFGKWYRQGLAELKGLLITVPFVALLAWGAYTLISSVCPMYPMLASVPKACLPVCVAVVPLSACIFCRFFWWGGLAASILVFPFMAGLSSWVFGLLLIALPFRCVIQAFIAFHRRGRAAENVHVVGVSGWR
jgi:hypothetical protein